MNPHGIYNSTAGIWVHGCPLALSFYAYWRVEMLSYLKNTKGLRAINGKSPDGTVTGQGFLVPCTAPFIRQFMPPFDFWENFEMVGKTDRQVGGQIEAIFERTLLFGCLPNFIKLRQSTGEAQLSGSPDFEQDERPSFEVKADCKGGLGEGSGNVFVQTHERGHKTNQVRSSDRGNQASPEVMDTDFYRQGEDSLL